MNKLTVSLLALAFPLTANALAVNTMQLIGNGKGNATFTLTNNMPYTEFVTGHITKYEPRGKEVIQVPYTEENINDWEITLTHPKLILEKGRSKAVGVRSLCSADCNFDTDHAYKIKFVPEPYKEDGKEQPAVSITVGYAPLYIIPAANPVYDIEIRHDGEQVYVNNKSNSFLNIGIDNCEEGQDVREAQCRTTFTILANRERAFNIYKSMYNKELRMYTINYNKTYHDRFILAPGETYKDN